MELAIIKNIIKKVLTISSIKHGIHICLCLISTWLVSCSRQGELKLACFEINNSIISATLDSLEKISSFDKERIVAINLHGNADSLNVICVSLQKDNISINYIHRENKRIVGYLEHEGRDYLLLSDINNRSDLIRFYRNYFVPSAREKGFPYLAYPTYQYNDPDTLGKWVTTECLFCPVYVIFQYKESKLIKTLMTRDVSGYERR